MEVLSRIPNVQDQLTELEQHGVPQPALIAALVMTPEELQAEAAAALPHIKRHLGLRRGQLKSFVTSGRTLKLPPAALEPAEASVEAKTQALERIDAVLGKYQRATRALTRQTKTSLVSDVRVRVVHVLLKHGFSKTKAFERTADRRSQPLRASTGGLLASGADAPTRPLHRQRA